MRYRGHVSIELKDKNTGDVQTVEHGNMITNAVSDILGTNPMGVFYNAGDRYDQFVMWSDTLLPICPNLIGGLLLFENPLNADPTNIYQFSENAPVAYASNDVNASSNLARGSLNLAESKPLENGYRFVWEFSPSQGNGTISSLALTSALGGKNCFGSMVEDATAFLSLRRTTLRDLGVNMFSHLYWSVSMDAENGLLTTIACEGNLITIRTLRVPVFEIGLNETLDGKGVKVVNEFMITTSTFKLVDTYNKYGQFFDGQDGYWYGFANQPNSSGNATMYWVRISQSDFSYTEGVWTLDNAHLKEVGSLKKSTYAERDTNAVVRDGYLYVGSYSGNGVYKINVQNPTDITFLEFGFETNFAPIGGTGSCEVRMTLIGDIIIGKDFMIMADDTIRQTAGDDRLENVATPIFRYKEFLITWGGSYSNNYCTIFLLTPFLASINNLGETIVKTADKTMKITYTLTEI